MSETQTKPLTDKQKQTAILAVIAVALVGILGILVYQSTRPTPEEQAAEVVNSVFQGLEGVVRSATDAANDH